MGKRELRTARVATLKYGNSNHCHPLHPKAMVCECAHLLVLQGVHERRPTAKLPINQPPKTTAPPANRGIHARTHHRATGQHTTTHTT